MVRPIDPSKPELYNLNLYMYTYILGDQHLFLEASSPMIAERLWLVLQSIIENWNDKQSQYKRIDRWQGKGNIKRLYYDPTKAPNWMTVHVSLPCEDSVEE